MGVLIFTPRYALFLELCAERDFEIYFSANDLKTKADMGLKISKVYNDIN